MNRMKLAGGGVLLVLGWIPAGSSAQDDTPPGQVTGQTMTLIGDRTASLAWNTAGDDGSAGTAAGYDIDATILDPQTHLPISGTTTTIVDAQAGPLQHLTLGGLQPESFYHVAIFAWDEADNVGAPGVVEFTTDDGGGGNPQRKICGMGAGGVGLGLPGFAALAITLLLVR